MYHSYGINLSIVMHQSGEQFIGISFTTSAIGNLLAVHQLQNFESNLGNIYTNQAKFRVL